MQCQPLHSASSASMEQRPTRHELAARGQGWSDCESRWAPAETTWGVDAGVLNLHAGRLDVPIGGLRRPPHEDFSWIMAGMKATDRAQADGDMGAFLPADVVKYSLPAPADRRQRVADVYRKCYQGLVLLIRRSLPTFWATPFSSLFDPQQYQQDQARLSVDGLVFLTGCLAWIRELVDGRFTVPAFQAYVQPSAATPLPPKRPKSCCHF